jgi:hypothetical protein
MEHYFVWNIARKRSSIHVVFIDRQSKARQEISRIPTPLHPIQPQSIAVNPFFLFKRNNPSTHPPRRGHKKPSTKNSKASQIQSMQPPSQPAYPEPSKNQRKRWHQSCFSMPRLSTEACAYFDENRHRQTTDVEGVNANMFIKGLYPLYDAFKQGSVDD